MVQRCLDDDALRASLCHRPRPSTEEAAALIKAVLARGPDGLAGRARADGRWGRPPGGMDFSAIVAVLPGRGDPDTLARCLEAA